jgi:PASTA domain
MTDTLPPPTIESPPVATKPMWKKKKFFIPIGVVGALCAIAAVAPSPDEQPEVSTPATEVEIPAPIVTEAPVEVEVPTAEAATAEVALMPNVVGMNLQDAQDLIQEHGVFLSLSEDATGQDRNQFIDSNWVVVGQNIEPGQPFGEGEAVLSVVKYTD